MPHGQNYQLSETGKENVPSEWGCCSSLDEFKREKQDPESDVFISSAK